MISNLSVLVIDDDSAMLDVLSTYLRDRGYEAVTASDGAEGLAALHAQDFDLVVSDINMAGMSGFEFIKRARLEYPDLGIVLMTAYDDEYPLSEALRAGADGYLTKPFGLRKFSLIFEKAYWTAIQRQDWWLAHADASS